MVEGTAGGAQRMASCLPRYEPQKRAMEGGMEGWRGDSFRQINAPRLWSAVYVCVCVCMCVCVLSINRRVKEGN